MRDGTSNLAQHEPEPEGLPRSAQVLQFRPRPRLDEPAFAHLLDRTSDTTETELDPLAQFEQDREDDEPVNYPQRMLMNVIAVAVVTVLIGVGVWLADTIADMERDQDCVLQGRQNCAPIEFPDPLQR